MKARIPQSAQPQNINKMLKEAQHMQEEMKKAQAELEDKTYTGNAGGGKVSVEVSGKRKVNSITIDPSVIDPDDLDFLQDMIVAAVNDGLTAAEDDANETMSKIAGPMNGMGMGL